MTARRRVGVALGLGSLLLAACGGNEDPPSAAAPGSATSSAPTESPTPEDLAGEAATAALQEMLRVTDSARQEPTAGDWEPQIRQYAADPAAFLAVQSVRDFATIGLRQDGETRVETEVADVQLAAAGGPSVRITGCYDSSSTQVSSYVQGGSAVAFLLAVGAVDWPQRRAGQGLRTCRAAGFGRRDASRLPLPHSPS